VRFVANGLSEDEAFALEIERIAHWRELGVLLVNWTDGGEGVSGLVHSEESKNKMSIGQLLKGDGHPSKRQETKDKMSVNNGMKNPVFYAKCRAARNRPEVCASQGEKISGDKNPMKRADVRSKFCGENSPQKRPAARARMSGDNNPMCRPEVRAAHDAALAWIKLCKQPYWGA
jgi:hypothetical protein